MNTLDMIAFMCEPFFKFMFCFASANYQKRIRLTDNQNRLLITLIVGHFKNANISSPKSNPFGRIFATMVLGK